MRVRRAVPMAPARAIVGHIPRPTCSIRHLIASATAGAAVAAPLLLPPIPSRPRSCMHSSAMSSSAPGGVVGGPFVMARRHATTTTTSMTRAAAARGVPKEVLQRITANKREMMRLVRLAAGQTAVRVSKVEEMIARHLSLEGMPREVWRAAVWRELRMHCYVTIPRPGGSATEREECVVPLDWTATCRYVASLVPYEGWTERDIQECLQRSSPVLARLPPAWLPQYSGVDSFARLVQRNYPSLFVLTRSAVTGDVIYHRVGHNSISATWRPPSPQRTLDTERMGSKPLGSSRTCAAVQHALHALGRGHQLPVWSDAAEVVPLLPSGSRLADTRPSTWQKAFRRDVVLRGALILDGYVRIRAAHARRPLTVVVDCTSVSPAELAALLQERGVGRSDGASATVKLLRREDMPPQLHAEYVRVSTATAAASTTLVEDVLVDTLLEPEHLLVALVESAATDAARDAAAHEAAEEAEAVEAEAEEDDAEVTEADRDAPAPLLPSSSGALQMIVLCGAASRETFAAVLADTRLPTVGEITITTPEAATRV